MNMKEEIMTEEEEGGENFTPTIPPTQTPYTESDSDPLVTIKEEEVEFHFHNSTSDTNAEDDAELKPLSSIPFVHIDPGSTDSEETDLMNQLYLDLLQLDLGCETCLMHLRALSQHTRATHPPPQDPLLMDPLYVDPDPDPDLPSAQIKCEIVDNIERMDMEECPETEVKSSYSASDPDFELGSGSESDPEYKAPSYWTKEKKCRSPREKWKCLECGENFPRLIYLTSHMSGVHDGVKAFKCDVCLKRFSVKGTLTTHMRIHTGEKPFESDLNCDQSTRESLRQVQGQDFRKHRTLRKGPNRQKPYKEFKCDECDRMFMYKSQLEIHKRFHSGVKPFQCDECGKRFYLKSNLTTHMIVHTGEKPFECGVCAKRFAYKQALTLHMTTHANKRPC